MSKTAMLLWIDHQEAKVVTAEGALLRTVQAAPPEREVDEERKKPNKPTASGRRAEGLHDRFFAEVAAHLREAGPLLLCGPSTAKVEFSRFLERKAAPIAREVIGVQALDHPTDRQLAAFARNYFAPPAR